VAGFDGDEPSSVRLCCSRNLAASSAITGIHKPDLTSQAVGRSILPSHYRNTFEGTMSAPYPGQGIEVPNEDGIVGEWVCQGQVFLFEQPADQSILVKRFSNGETGIGFNISMVSSEFKKSPADILRYNALKMLSLRVEDSPDKIPGADATELFIFTTPDGFELRIPVGSAVARGTA
jgi:hypothetical protein